MHLKKSIEKAKQQREAAQRTAVTDLFAQEKAESPVSKDTGADSPENTEVAEAFSTGAENNFRKWTPPVYRQSRSIEVDLNKLSQNRLVCMFPDAPEAEYYKVLRANIQRRTRLKKWNTIMITSVQPGEGKTLTAINLALSFARELNHTVLLVDCDLRRQSICRYLNLPGDKGIIDYLENDCALKDIIVWPNIDKLTLISGGRITANSSELIGSPKMRALVEEMKNRYGDRYLIFDVPPIMSGADAIAFAPMVDCIVMVVEEGRTSVDEVKKALEMIPAEKFLGFVLNRSTAPASRYYY